MFLRFRKSISGATAYRAGKLYDVSDLDAAELVAKGYAEPSTVPPPHVADLLARLDDGADRPCLSLPYSGIEFGHVICSHIRLTHFHKSSRKVVCCRPGEQVLFPSAAAHVTDWTDPVPDAQRIGTFRDNVIQWPDLLARFPDLYPIRAGGLTPQQELYAIRPDIRIPFRPVRRGLRADILLGVRHRQLFPERNWGNNWQTVADHLNRRGITFAVIGARPTTLDLDGQTCHTGDLDTDAAVELLQQARLYIGTDSGASHLAAAVAACPMMIFRETRSGSRDLTPRMRQTNPDLTVVPQGWERPERVLKAIDKACELR